MAKGDRVGLEFQRFQTTVHLQQWLKTRLEGEIPLGYRSVWVEEAIRDYIDGLESVEEEGSRTASYSLPIALREEIKRIVDRKQEISGSELIRNAVRKKLRGESFEEIKKTRKEYFIPRAGWIRVPNGDGTTKDYKLVRRLD